MKKSILFFLLLGILIPLSSWAQKQNVLLANATAKKVLIDDQIINPRASKELSLTVKGGVAQFSLAYYDGLVLKESVNLARKVNKGRIILKDFDPTNNDVPDASVMDEEVTSKGATADFGGTAVNSGNQVQNPDDWWSYATVKPKNGLKGQSLFVPSEPFKGLALASGQQSSRSATLKTGEIMFPALLMEEKEEASTKNGINYTWAIVDKIIVEGQDVLEIKPENIMKANDGDLTKKTIVSKLGFPFIIAEGASSGKVVSDNIPTRLDLYIGWNILPIQYKGPDGLPVQAILILLVDDSKKPLMTGSKSKEQNISIGRNDITIMDFKRPTSR
ncbi:MAG: hypothetical protein HY931_03990 [Candidatus Falkowbacteria bacterium]|nr:MAG: hypothetical protein HY931_03990 [Candidatus Falkowbacteria bacterium]